MSFESYVKNNAPSILTGIGLVAGAGALFFTYKCAPKIDAVLNDPTLTKGQKFLGVMKAGAPAIALSVISGGCVIGAQVKSNQQIAASTAVAAVATRELHEFHAKTKEVVGEETYNEIRQSIAEDKAKNSTNSIVSPSTDIKHINIAGGGNQLWYDERHDRWFRASISRVEEAVANFNKNLEAYDFSSYGNLYSDLDLTVPTSDEHVGFTTFNCRNGIHLIKDSLVTYPDTNEVARVLCFEELPELDPDVLSGGNYGLGGYY